MQLKLCLLTLSNLIWFAFICNTSFVTLNHKGIVCSTVLSLLAQGYTGKNEYIAAQGERFSSIQLLLLPQSRRKFEHKQWIEWSLYLKYYWFSLYLTPTPCCRWSVDLSSCCLFVKLEPTIFYTLNWKKWNGINRLALDKLMANTVCSWCALAVYLLNFSLHYFTSFYW